MRVSLPVLLVASFALALTVLQRQNNVPSTLLGPNSLQTWVQGFTDSTRQTMQLVQVHALPTVTPAPATPRTHFVFA